MRSVIFLGLIVLFFLPSVALADCADLGNFTGWVAEGAHQIRFYEGERPIAVVNVLDCGIHPGSRIRLLDSYVCDSSSLEIDGKACSLMTVRSLY
jgi:hypothetical protein